MMTALKIEKSVLKIVEWKARNGLRMLRISLGVIFIWFGFIKFFPNLSVAEEIASKTILYLSDGFITEKISMPVLAFWECTIGLGLLIGKKIKFILLLLYLQMIGTLSPLLIFPEETWTATYFVPTLLGQYIIKNAVLISAGIVIGATSNGGHLISNPQVAVKALHLEDLYRRYKKRFDKNPKR